MPQMPEKRVRKNKVSLIALFKSFFKQFGENSWKRFMI